MINILYAYPYIEEKGLLSLYRYKNEIRFLLDSGAFTAFKSGIKIEIDRYIDFIKALPVRPYQYFTLDVIGDPAKTRKNYERMLSKGLKPIPVFTRGEDINIIDYFYSTSDIVGIGSLVGTRDNKQFLKFTMENGIKGRKCHWLGFTVDNFIRYYKPFMVDCSSWINGQQYGNMNLLDFETGKIIIFHRKTFKTKPGYKVMRLIERYGYDIEQIKREKNWHGGAGKSISSTISSMSWIELMVNYERKYNTKLFLVCTIEHHVDGLIYCYNRLKNLKII